MAQLLWERPALAGAYNFGPEPGDAVAVREVVELARAAYGEGDVQYGDGGEGPHETAWLALQAAKARSVLGVSPTWTLVQAVMRTMIWYRMQHDGADARDLCHSDIADFEARSAAAEAPSAAVKLAG